jgi:hypothetical protein
MSVLVPEIFVQIANLRYCILIISHFFSPWCSQQFDKCFDCLDECKDKAEFAEKKCDAGWKPDWYGCEETSCSSQTKCIFDKCKMKCEGCSGKTACGDDCREKKKKCKKDCRDRRVLAAKETVDDLKLNDRRLGSTKKCLKKCRRSFKECKKD